MKVGIIADDLTGANGTGVKLATTLGLKAKTSFYYKPIRSSNSISIICLDTDSRYVSPADAKQRVLETVVKLIEWDADLIGKRIDSTFRGNIGPELDVLLDTIEESVAVIVPAFPSNGRTVVGGHLLVNGKPLHETDVAKDPVSPLVNSYLPEILEQQTSKKIALIELSEVSQGSSTIKHELERCIKGGIKLVVCDAVTEEHIESIAVAMKEITNMTMIPADPGPLTTAFANELKRSSVTHEPKILVSVGSATAVSESQITYLANQLRLEPVYVRPDHLATFSESWEMEVERTVQAVHEVMETQEVIVVTTNHASFPLVDFKKLSKLEGVSEDLLAKRITAGLAEISKRVLQNGNGSVKGCFFSGGDVTASFCDTAQADGIELVGEVMPLVAHGTVSGGEFEGISVVTKGGMVGDQTAIYESVTYLQHVLNKKERMLNEA